MLLEHNSLHPVDAESAEKLSASGTSLTNGMYESRGALEQEFSAKGFIQMMNGS